MMILITLFACYFWTGAGNLCVVHVGLVPVLNVVGEQVRKNIYTCDFAIC